MGTYLEGGAAHAPQVDLDAAGFCGREGTGLGSATSASCSKSMTTRAETLEPN
jgi:hypothetical protein